MRMLNVKQAALLPKAKRQCLLTTLHCAVNLSTCGCRQHSRLPALSERRSDLPLAPRAARRARRSGS